MRIKPLTKKQGILLGACAALLITFTVFDEQIVRHIVMREFTTSEDRRLVRIAHEVFPDHKPSALATLMIARPGIMFSITNRDEVRAKNYERPAANRDLNANGIIYPFHSRRIDISTTQSMYVLLCKLPEGSEISIDTDPFSKPSDGGVSNMERDADEVLRTFLVAYKPPET